MSLVVQSLRELGMSSARSGEQRQPERQRWQRLQARRRRVRRMCVLRAAEVEEVVEEAPSSQKRS